MDKAMIIIYCVCAFIGFSLAFVIKIVSDKKKNSRLSELEKNLSEKSNSLVKAELSLKETESEISEKEKILVAQKVELSEFKENIAQKEKSIESLQTEKEELGKKLTDREEKNKFIAQIIEAVPDENVDVEEFKKLLNNDYIKFADGNDSLAEEASQVLILKNVERQLEFLTYDTPLLNKNIIAIAGSFSSGKSSFMNSFFTSRKTILPIGMDQTTAISSYVLPYNETDITACTWKGGRISVPQDIFRAISHSKMSEFNFNLKHVLNHFVFKNEFVVDLQNICFIDTPGFNPGKESKTDYETAISSISTADALLWCFDASAGTLKDDELDILCEICDKNPNLKIYIVANKGDLKSLNENEDVITNVENMLNDNGINYDGISLYSSRELFGNQNTEFDEFRRGMSLNEFFEQFAIENTTKEKELISKVESVFNAYIDADEKRIEKNTEFLKALTSLDSSFADTISNLEADNAYYKARMDSKKWKDSKKRNDFDADSSSDNITETIEEIKTDFRKVIASDKADIEKAQELSQKMQNCVSKVFGHQANKSTQQSIKKR